MIYYLQAFIVKALGAEKLGISLFSAFYLFCETKKVI